MMEWPFQNIQTIFNALTGLRQHTGNWPGKTVSGAQGRYYYKGDEYILTDLPGTYSLMAHSAEEEVARDFILFGGADTIVVVCDATCLERNLNLALQTIEITPHVNVCVNLMDEAKKKEISIDLKKLENLLGVPVIGANARDKEGLDGLMSQIATSAHAKAKRDVIAIQYHESIEQAIMTVEPILIEILTDASCNKDVNKHALAHLNSRWLAVQLIACDNALCKSIHGFLGFDILVNSKVDTALQQARNILRQADIPLAVMKDMVVASILQVAEQICNKAVTHQSEYCHERDRKLDRILTSKRTGIPIMLALLWLVFWLTLTGANIPSQILSNILFGLQDFLSGLFLRLGAPDWLHGLFILGMFRVLAWVVAVMLPPMAIFFPMFTLLEDFGYLPRIAFILDHQFKKAHACGKQALTMCMGFGCNAVGVTGCRIIDSPRERLIAILTNNFVPCNGRFPTLIAIATMFFTGMVPIPIQSFFSTLILTGVITLGVLLTFFVSRILSMTILRGEASSFTLELPPYRTPQLGKVIVRSLLDRTVFVLGRAVAVAAPAGMVIWILANTHLSGTSLLMHFAQALNPFAQMLGMDGVILLSFILGFPANELVVPIIIMAYMCSGSILSIDNLAELRNLLVQNGWTPVTAVSTMLFCLVHWPCSTTCLTIKKETGSILWAALAIAIPMIVGITICFLFATVARAFGFV